MHRVQQANQSPFRCAVLPFKGNSSARGGFIDTGQHLRDEKVYICMEAAVEIAKEIGWTPPSAVLGLHAELEAKQVRIEQLEEELAEADKLIEASKYSLERFGATVKQKPGPKGPRKKEVAA